MLRCFFSHYFHGVVSVLVPRGSPWKSAPANPLIRPKRCFGISSSREPQAKSNSWIRGVGVGLALALGLKYSYDSAETSCESEVQNPERNDRFANAIEVSRDLVERIKAEVGAPGLVAGVSVDGDHVWLEGFGYADLENRVPCTPQTVMRIASISKSLTAAAAARLWEMGKLDFDVPVQKYVPEFPQKYFDGEVVTITPRMLLSHLSGIRHYEKHVDKVKDKEKTKTPLKLTAKEEEDEKHSSEGNKENSAADLRKKNHESTQHERKKEFEHKEYYLKENFKNVVHALNLFKDDPLVHKPGTTFLYSTHAFTLLSAVMERAAGQPFLDIMNNMFRELGMLNTFPEENDPLIYHRSRFYHLNKKGRVVNCPYVDNSYKWAGGGFLSTAGDLLLFGNAILYSYQVAHLAETKGMLPGFLKPKSSIELWTPVDRTEPSWDKAGVYAQGWMVVEELQKYGHCRKLRHYVSHTGGAVGASSVLLVLPKGHKEQGQGQIPVPPQGVVVTIITNMQSVGLNTTALKIALEFDKVIN